MEGIQGIGGIRLPESGFLKELERLCRENGALLILDEIQSGYGRSGRFFAHQYEEIRPDIITMAKGMGNGFPIGGVLISPDIQAWHGMLGTTFGGNHLACAAAIAVLEVIQSENLIAKAGATGAFLMEKISQIDEKIRVRGRGLMIGVEFPGPVAQIRKTLLNEFHIFTGFSGTTILRLLPPLSLTEEEATRFTDALALIMQRTVTREPCQQ